MMNQKIVDLFDEYTHKPLSRKVFIRRLAKLTGSTAAAMSLLPLLEVDYARAATIAVQDSEIKTGYVSYPVFDGEMKAYEARPAEEGVYGSVMVIHENRGLNPHIEDVARRVAKEGFIALAPDALSLKGGTPDDSDQARAMIRELDADKNLKRFLSGIEYLNTADGANSKVGCVGFCWGGGMANKLAVVSPELDVAVPFYGRQAPVDDVPKIRAALMLHYGELDKRINEGIPAYEQALKEADKEYQLYIYEGAQHAFHNDTAPTRYDEKAAKLAWSRTIAFFKEKLG